MELLRIAGRLSLWSIMAGGQIISQPVLVMGVGVDESGPKQKGGYVKSKDPKVGGVAVLKRETKMASYAVGR